MTRPLDAEEHHLPPGSRIEPLGFAAGARAPTESCDEALHSAEPVRDMQVRHECDRMTLPGVARYCRATRDAWESYHAAARRNLLPSLPPRQPAWPNPADRKSTRLNSSHVRISY